MMSSDEPSSRSVEAAAYILLTDDTGNRAYWVVADAAQRLWVLHRGKLRMLPLSGVAQHVVDLAEPLCRGLFRAHSDGPGARDAPRTWRPAAVQRFADAVCRLHGRDVLGMRTMVGPPGATLMQSALTNASDAWVSRVLLGPGPVAAFVEVARTVQPACAAIVADDAAGEPTIPRDRAGWYDESGKLTQSAFHQLETMCWALQRAAFFLSVQACVDATAAADLEASVRTMVIDRIASNLLPSLDTSQLVESIYQLYLDGSTQPGDTAHYSRKTAFVPCRPSEVVHSERGSVYREAIAELRVGVAEAVRGTDNCWPHDMARPVRWRLSQFAREVVLLRATAMFCTLRAVSAPIGRHVKNYSDLECRELGWWSADDVTYPCIVRTGNFWVLFDADMRPRCHATDVVDAFCWLLTAMLEAGDSTAPLLNRLGFNFGGE
ncbi:MAG: hypothetical protein WC732_09710 [Candidatus Omnitrophota bacterium]